jgi:hypothetical protein
MESVEGHKIMENGSIPVFNHSGLQLTTLESLQVRIDWMLLSFTLTVLLTSLID